MRRVLCIIMVVLLIVTIITGIADHVRAGSSALHIVTSLLFIASTIFHVVINKKLFARYLSGKDDS
jgi:hypothetical protein